MFGSCDGVPYDWLSYLGNFRLHVIDLPQCMIFFLCRFAYVEFTESEAVECAQALDESLFRGRQIKVCTKVTSSCFMHIRPWDHL